MGRLNLNKNNNQARKDFHNSYFSGLHKATVNDVNVDQGTVSVKVDGLLMPLSIAMPLLGLSCPYRKDENDTTYMMGASWGRYIPQKGDQIIVGFDSTGDAFAVGYFAASYMEYTYLDQQRESKGGIGWGDASGKRIQQGDWDFKSSRGSSLYMGDNVKLASGPHSVALNKTTGDVTITSGLIQEQFGEAGKSRKGSAKRFILPTDATETYIFSLIPGNNTKAAQESYDVVNYSSLAGIPIELTRIHHGEVVNDLTKTVMVPALNPNLAPLPLLTGTSVRMLHSVKDPTGMYDYYVSAIDNLGNYGVSAPTAIGFQWMTPTATWQINNLNTLHTSTGMYSLTSPSITLTGATSILLSSPSIALSGTTITGVAAASVSFAAPAITLAGAATATIAAPVISTLGITSLGAPGGLPLLTASPALLAAWAAYFGAAAAAWGALVGTIGAPATAAAAAATTMAIALGSTTMVTGT